jgi:hypothetical protein
LSIRNGRPALSSIRDSLVIRFANVAEPAVSETQSHPAT